MLYNKEEYNIQEKNNLIRCMLYDKQYIEKPKERKIGLIQNNMKAVKLEIVELAFLVSRRATIRPTALKGKSAKDWSQQQLFGLDFDNYMLNEVQLPSNKKHIADNGKQSHTLLEVDEEYLYRQIDAIRSLNPEKKKSVYRDNMVTNIKNNLYNSSQYIHISDTLDTYIEINSYEELYGILMRIDLSEYLGVQIDTKIKCILPEHDDEEPSANLYVAENGTQLYKCFGCGTALNIIQLTMKLANCRKKIAVKFISDLYNIKLKDSAWINEQKKQINNFCYIIYTKRFEKVFPNLNSVLGTRKKYLEKMLKFIAENIKEDLVVSSNPVVFASYDTLLKFFEIRKRETVTQSILLFTLLGLVNKTPIWRIPIQYAEIAVEIQQKYRHHKITNYYSKGDFAIDYLMLAEEKAKILKENNMTYRGLSREFVYRTFGQAEADRCFPQYKKENSKGTNKKSDETVQEIVELIYKRIKEQGYCFVKEITENKKYELQWRKAIAEILNSYSWKKIKVNKKLKEELKINVKGYPMVITNDE